MATFTSSSTVLNFLSMFRDKRLNLLQWMEKVAVACIGPITAKTAEDNGIKVTLSPEEYTMDALTTAIVEYYSINSRND
jgi:uroporphyrinogen III methyltransferase / synthase